MWRVATRHNHCVLCHLLGPWEFPVHCGRISEKVVDGARNSVVDSSRTDKRQAQSQSHNVCINRSVCTVRALCVTKRHENVLGRDAWPLQHLTRKLHVKTQKPKISGGNLHFFHSSSSSSFSSPKYGFYRNVLPAICILVIGLHWIYVKEKRLRAPEQKRRYKFSCILWMFE